LGTPPTGTVGRPLEGGLSLFVVDAFSSQAFLAATYGSHFSAATDGMDKEKTRAAFSQQGAVN